MDEPDNLARVSRKPCRKSRRNQHVDRAGVARRQVEHPPGTSLVKQRVLASGEWQRHALRVVAPQAKLCEQRPGVKFRPIADEGHACFSDDYFHVSVSATAPPAS